MNQNRKSLALDCQKCSLSRSRYTRTQSPQSFGNCSDKNSTPNQCSSGENHKKSRRRAPASYTYFIRKILLYCKKSKMPELYTPRHLSVSRKENAFVKDYYTIVLSAALYTQDLTPSLYCSPICSAIIFIFSISVHTIPYQSGCFSRIEKILSFHE